jgi:haloalkane dehalogenase
VISTIEPDKNFLEINGRRMAYVETGTGAPIVFQHGNPTSSYLWRNIIPHLSDQGRCIAVDLIGMGDSDKLADSGPRRYRYSEHRDYLFAAWDALGIRDNVTLVIHDWGSALGFDWAFRNPASITGIAYMEALVMPVSWDQWPEKATEMFRGFRSPAGEAMVLEKNLFIERVLPASVLRELSAEEMTVYRRPFLQPGEDRRPTLTWPRQIPIDGEPVDVCRIVADYSTWMAQNELPKLFINADPGAILIGEQREYCRQWKNHAEVTVRGNHFLQEE